LGVALGKAHAPLKQEPDQFHSVPSGTREEFPALETPIHDS